MEMLICDWANVEPRIREAAASRAWCCSGRRDLPFASSQAVNRCTDWCGGNYLEPAKPERGLFNAFPNRPTPRSGHGGTVVLPSAEASVFHFEPGNWRW